MNRATFYLSLAVVIAVGVYVGGQALHLWIEQRRKAQADQWRLLRESRRKQAEETARLAIETRPRIGFNAAPVSPAAVPA